jgi:hypothetical protein
MLQIFESFKAAWLSRDVVGASKFLVSCAAFCGCIFAVKIQTCRNLEFLIKKVFVVVNSQTVDNELLMG